MRQELHEKIDLLNDIYLPVQVFNTEVKVFASQKQVDELRRRVDRCAQQEKVVGMFDRLDRMQESTSRRMNADFITKESVNMKLRDTESSIKMDMMTKTVFGEWRTGIEDRLLEANTLTFECKKALQNHTKHITAVKKDIESRAKNRTIDEMVKQMKRFALNDEY